MLCSFVAPYWWHLGLPARSRVQFFVGPAALYLVWILTKCNLYTEKHDTMMCMRALRPRCLQHDLVPMKHVAQAELPVRCVVIIFFYWKTLTNVLKWELPRHNFHFKKANQEWYLYVLCHICGYSIIFDFSCVAPSLRWISHINVSYFSLFFFSLLLIMLFVVCYFFHVSTFL